MNWELPITDSLITEPSGSVLTLDYVKQHIRALGNTDDVLVQTYIDAATGHFEEQTGRQLLTATREVWLDAFPFIGGSGRDARIELPYPPLQFVESVSYLDADGVLQSFTDGGSPETDLFTTNAPVGPYARRGFVEPIYGQMWPTAQCTTGAVRIRYVCGYGMTPDEIPALVRNLLCGLVAQFDMDRSLDKLPAGVQIMLDGFKYSALPSQVLRQYATWVSNAPTWWPR